MLAMQIHGAAVLLMLARGHTSASDLQSIRVLSLHVLQTILGSCPLHSEWRAAAAGAERFKPSVNEGRVAELEMLQGYLRDALAKLDSQIEGKVAPLERMKRLLTAPDKKAKLLEMAGERLGSPLASRALLWIIPSAGHWLCNMTSQRRP